MTDRDRRLAHAKRHVESLRASLPPGALPLRVCGVPASELSQGDVEVIAAYLHGELGQADPSWLRARSVDLRAGGSRPFNPTLEMIRREKERRARERGVTR